MRFSLSNICCFRHSQNGVNLGHPPADDLYVKHPPKKSLIGSCCKKHSRVFQSFGVLLVLCAITALILAIIHLFIGPQSPPPVGNNASFVDIPDIKVFENVAKVGPKQNTKVSGDSNPKEKQDDLDKDGTEPKPVDLESEQVWNNEKDPLDMTRVEEQDGKFKEEEEEDNRPLAEEESRKPDEEDQFGDEEHEIEDLVRTGEEKTTKGEEDEDSVVELEKEDKVTEEEEETTETLVYDKSGEVEKNLIKEDAKEEKQQPQPLVIPDFPEPPKVIIAS